MKKLTTIAFIVLAVSGLAQATIIVKYDFGDYPNETLASTEGTDHISASEFGYTGNGDTDFWGGDEDEGDAYSAYGGWDDLTYTDYFYFTITIDNGWSLDVSNLQFDIETGDFGPYDGRVTYVANSAENIIRTDIEIGGDWYTYNTTYSSNPTGLTGDVTFKIYGKNTPVGGGFFAIDNVILNGTVNQIPEPTTICLLGLGVFSLIRRKNKQQYGENCYPAHRKEV